MESSKKSDQNLEEEYFERNEEEKNEETFVTPQKSVKLKGKNIRVFTIDDFEIGMYLGGGRFGRVYLGRLVENEYLVAIKRISKKYLIEGKLEHQLAREITIQSNLSHPNVLKMHTFFHDEKYVNLVLEWCYHGELYSEIKRHPKRKLNEAQVAYYTVQVIAALEYLEAKKVIHRDIKPENILNSFVFN